MIDREKWRNLIRNHGSRSVASELLNTLKGYRQNTEMFKRQDDSEYLQQVINEIYSAGHFDGLKEAAAKADNGATQ